VNKAVIQHQKKEKKNKSQMGLIELDYSATASQTRYECSQEISAQKPDFKDWIVRTQTKKERTMTSQESVK
jgi:hypothetical protein